MMVMMVTTGSYYVVIVIETIELLFNLCSLNKLKPMPFPDGVVLKLANSSKAENVIIEVSREASSSSSSSS